MKISFLNNLIYFAFITFFISTIFSACDTTSSNGERDEHPDAIGFVLQDRTDFNIGNDHEILRHDGTEFIFNPDGQFDDYFRNDIDGIVISSAVIDLTQEIASGMTPKLIIRWIGIDGDVFDLPDLDEDEGGEFWLMWEWRNPNTDPPSPHENVLTDECSSEDREDVENLELIRPANLEQHGSDGVWGFHFRADHAGETQIRFRLMHGHGATAHPDFTSPWLNVIIPHDEHELIDENGIYLHDRDKCRTR
jgi:hypothetical protein